MVGKHFSHYKILEEIGRGGMGMVYKAEDTRLKRPVALKFLPPDLTRDKEANARFIQEAQAASALDHQNICTIYEIDQSKDGQLFIVMAYYEGETLKERMARGIAHVARSEDRESNGGLQMEEAIDIAIQIAQGLSKAHTKGIIHRDIKPSNIIVQEDGTVKIIDFGLSKLLGRQDLTQSGKVMGTVSYMSPEQVRGIAVDHRTDVWSLGVVLYEMLTGKLPFKGENEIGTMYSVLNEKPQPLTTSRPDTPMVIEQVVSKALAKHLNDRYQHIEEMLDDLLTIRESFVRRTKTKRIKARSQKGKRVFQFGAAVILFILLTVGGLRLFNGRSEVIDSIAVLPLSNLSGDPEQEYFADGMTEVLIAELGKIGALRVISRTSVMQYKGISKPLSEIAQELKVDAVVEGSVQRSGSRFRITTQLYDSKTEQRLWGDLYERDLRDVLTLQSEVARAIAREIRITVTPEEQVRLSNVRPVNQEAYHAYLKGRFHWEKHSEAGLLKSIEYFQKAIEIDSSYANPHVGLADAYYALGVLGIGALPIRELMLKAKAAAIRAVELDESLVEAHASLGNIILLHDWDWSRAEKEFERASELNPNHARTHLWYSHFFTTSGRHEKAIAAAQRAQDLDPLSLTNEMSLGMQYYHARQYDQAIEIFHNTLDMDPNFFYAYSGLGLAYSEKGMFDKGILALERAVSGLGDGETNILAMLGAVYAAAGREDEARKIIEDLEQLAKQRYISSVQIAAIYASLGEKDEVMTLLEKDYHERSNFMVWLNVIPHFDVMRSDPRYISLLKKVGLEK